MDEVFLAIHGERHYLWRAVDRDGHALDMLVHDGKTSPRCHWLSAPAYRQKMAQQFHTWREITGTTRAASGTSELLPIHLCPP
jgi:hypothetical protein